MMIDFDDLLVDIPRHVVPDAAAAWRDGTRRRRRRYAAEAAITLAVVLLVGVGLVRLGDRALEPVPSNRTSGVESHPRDIPRPWLERDLPDRPGPLAAVLRAEDGGWRGVAADGRSWRLPGLQVSDVVPVLSADGTRLGLLSGGRFVVRDLVTGEQQAYPELGEARLPLAATYWASPQTPGLFSPDGRRLVVRGGEDGDRKRVNVLLLDTVLTADTGADGAVQALRVGGFPIGWSGSDRLVFLSSHGDRLLETDIAGTVERSVPLTGPPATRFDQWSGSVSPDGRLVQLSTGASQDRVQRTYRLDTGALVDERRTTVEGCQPAWQDGAASDSDPAIVAESWGATCVLWASDALAGPAQSGPGVTAWRYWPQWWWTTLAVVLGSAPLGWWLTRRTVRRR